jgi:hypothetical protein
MSISFRIVPALGTILWLCLSLPAHAAHPLITEDTGTQGSGHFQLEFTSETMRVRETGQRQHVLLNTAVLAWGFIETADLLVTVPWLRLGQPDSVQGLTDVGLDIKWRFYETGPVSFAFKPGVTFPTGDDTKNLGAGRHTWSAYVVASVDLKPWAFHLHLGHLHNNNLSNDRVNIWHASIAATYQVLDSLKLVFDTGVDTNTDRGADSDPFFAIAGLIWSVRPNLDLDLGVRTERSDSMRTVAALAGMAVRW